MTTPTLRLDEANELLSAWTAHTAAEHGIRILLLKGRALSDFGLRAPRVSADVDVLVDPARIDDFCAIVLEAGWEEFPGTFASGLFTVHSRSFRRSGWPNSFDVHHAFPGFLRDAGEVFETLWERRTELRFAHRPAFVPDRSASILVLALHSLRSTTTQRRHRAELEQLLTVALTSAEKEDLAALARRTGAAAPLRHVLPALGVPIEVAPDELRTTAYRDWHRKAASTHGAAAFWLPFLAHAPWRDKPRIVARALWPSREDFAVNHPEVPDRRWPQFRARVARLGRGFARLPHAIAALWRR